MICVSGVASGSDAAAHVATSRRVWTQILRVTYVHARQVPVPVADLGLILRERRRACT